MNRPGTPNNSGRHHLLLSSSPVHDDSSKYKTALTGATLAFQKKSSRPSPAVSSRDLDNGALIAATSASRDPSLSRPTSRASNVRVISRQTTGNSTQNGGNNIQIEHAAISQRLAQLQTTQYGQNPSLLRRPGRPAMDPRSPSFIAATLAASRSASVSPHQTDQAMHPYAQQTTAMRGKRKGSIGGTCSAASSVTDLDLTDTTSIPPTNALVSMFEKKGDDMDPVKRGPVSKTGTKPRLRPLTPPRTLSPFGKQDVSPSIRASNLAWERATPPPASVSDVSLSRSLPSRGHPPTPPPARAWRLEPMDTEEAGRVAPRPQRKPRTTTPPAKSDSQAEVVIHSPQPRRRTASQKLLSSDELGVSGKQPPLRVARPKPQPPSINTMPNRPSSSRGRISSPEPPLRTSSTTSSQDTFVSASSAPSPEPMSPPRGRPRPTVTSKSTSTSAVTMTTFSPTQVRPPSSPHSAPNRSPRRQPIPPPPKRTQAPNLPLASLTSATMAGILASSRAPPITAITLPTPPSRSQTPHMRRTLRQAPSKSDNEEEDKEKSRHLRKKHLGHSKKHAHHEGARRRWREEITARKRKRYEGVWASNRGLLLLNGKPGPSGSPPSDQGSQSGSGNGNELVVNVVVRDIWARSRLPFDELAEVWDLVDGRGRGVLDKTEFVVGMWLIDQRLRGRKIPQKVGESVWYSAQGVRVPGPKEKKK